VKEHRRTPEQQKDYIFDIYSKWLAESLSDHFLIHYQRLLEQIYIWCKDYSFKKDIDNIGEEITVVVRGIMKKTLDKDSFFKYLTGSIKKGKAGFYRKYNENEIIKVPRDKKRKLREVEDFIRMKESQLGRKLTSDEQTQSISKWFKITEKKAREYLELINIKYVDSLSYADDENKEIDVEDTNSENPLDEYIAKTDMQTVREAVESVLEKKQERSRDCYRALFTLYCIENYKDFEELNPVLDRNVIEACRSGKNPNQYEIYQLYHPNAQKPSAEAMASKNLSEFLSDIEAYLKEKNQ